MNDELPSNKAVPSSDGKSAAWWTWAPVVLLAMLLPLVLGGPEAASGPLLACLALGLAPAAALRVVGRFSVGALRWGLALALMAWLWRKGALSWPDTGRLAEHWGLLVLGLALAPLQPILGALRWRTLLAAADCPISFGASLRLTLVGSFFSLFIPGGTGGDVARAGVVGMDRGRWGAAVASVALDRLLGVPPLLLLMAGAWFLERSFIAETPAYSWMTAVMWPSIGVVKRFGFSQPLMSGLSMSA